MTAAGGVGGERAERGAAAQRVQVDEVDGTTDPLAIAELVAARLCVSLTFAALVTRLGPQVAGVPLAGAPIRRAVYAPIPPEGVHPAVDGPLTGLRS